MIKIFNHVILSRNEYNRLIHDLRFSRLLISFNSYKLDECSKRLRTVDTLIDIHDYLMLDGNDIRFEELVLNLKYQIEDDFSLVKDFLC